MCSHAAWTLVCVSAPRGIPEGLHRTPPRTHSPHREIRMINMSPGEQEAGNGHAVLESAGKKKARANAASEKEDEFVVTRRRITTRY